MQALSGILFLTRFLFSPLPYSATAVKLCAVPTSGMMLSRITPVVPRVRGFWGKRKLPSESFFIKRRTDAVGQDRYAVCFLLPSPLWLNGDRLTSSFSAVRLHGLHKQ